MNWFNNLTKLQKVILILIAGVVALIGLNGLSYTYQDYYVTNAVSTAFFWGILLLVLFSPLLYLARRKENKNREAKKLDEAKKLVTEDEEKTKKVLDKLESINQSEVITNWNGIAVDRHIAGSIIYKMKHDTPLDPKEENILKSLKEKF